MYGDRRQLRAFIVACWRKRLDGQPLSPLEAMVADIIAMHPEYHPMLLSEQAQDQEWPTPENGTNPFLHLSLHLAVAEQLQTGQPPGLAAIVGELSRRNGDQHAALHRVMEVLEQCLWEGQREQRQPNLQNYFEEVNKLLK